VLGPEDPVVDAVAAACPILCGELFKVTGQKAAGPARSAVDLC
jgi:hypothetical protein